MLDLNPTEVTDHFKARTDGVSSSDMLGGLAEPDRLQVGPIGRRGGPPWSRQTEDVHPQTHQLRERGLGHLDPAAPRLDEEKAGHVTYVVPQLWALRPPRCADFGNNIPDVRLPSVA